LKKCRPQTRSARHRHGELDHGQGRCVGGQDGLVATDAVERAEELLLDAQVLHHRLDHQLAELQLRQLGDAPHAAEGGVTLVPGELALVDLAAEGLLQAGQTGVGAGGRAAADHHLETRPCRHLGDALAHQPGPDDPNALDVHESGFSCSL